MEDLGTAARPHRATSPAPTAIDTLRATVEGSVLMPGDAGYDRARTLWNARIDKWPAVIVRCRGAADIAAGLRFAAEAGLPVSVKGGGHNIAGSAIVNGGVTLDLSGMREVRIDPAARRAVVAPGALLGDLDRSAARHGLAVPLGINSTTGVAGLTLGGGYGWLTRKHGLAIDNLVAAEIVTVSGARLRASADENSEIFWALRGGGGNFGVVVSFEFALCELRDVVSGLIVHRGADCAAVLRALRDMSGDLPDDLTVWAVLRQAPPLPFLSQRDHGTPVVVLACCWCGDPADADAALAPVRAIGTPIGEEIARQPYADWQAAFDPLTGPGARNYWKSHMFDDLADELVDIFAEGLERLPTAESEIFVAQLGGAPTRIDPAATAYQHRKAAFMMNLHARWQNPAEDTRCIAWAREFFDRTERHAAGGVYSNFMPEDEDDRARMAYGPAYPRLARLKAELDPGNLLRSNVNIPPGA